MYPGWSARDNYAIHKKRRKRKVKQVDSKSENASAEEDKSKTSELAIVYSIIDSLFINCWLASS